MKLEDFWNHHEVTDSGCWEWKMARDRKGYGTLGVLVDGEYRTRRAPRVAWELANGVAIPLGLVVMHKCDHPPCVNPAHLSLGTNKENSEDRDRKGRGRGGGPPGELHGRAVLTGKQVLEARELYSAGSISYTELGHIYGVCKQTMRLAITGFTWSHL